MPKNFDFKERGFNVDLLLSKFSDGREISADGKVSLTGFDFHFWEPVLRSSLYLDSKMDRALFGSALHNAIFDPDLPIEFTRSQFSSACRKQYNLLLNRKTKKYRALFDLTYLSHFPRKKIRIDGVDLYFDVSKTSKFMRAALGARRNLESEYDYIRKADTTNLMKVCAHVSATTEAEAFGKASAALDEVRGLVNLSINSSQVYRMSWGGKAGR